MELSQTSLALFFAVMIACGAFLGAFYDVTAILPAIFGRVFDLRLNEYLGGITLPIIKTRLKRRVTAFGKLACALSLFFHDLILMSFSGAAIALTVYRFNDGRWRVGGLACLIVGYALYRITLRRPVLCLAEILRFIFRAAAAYLVFFLWSPIRWLTDGCISIYKKLRSKRFEKHIRHYSEKEKKRILRAAREGSLDGKIKFNGEKYARRKKEKPNSDLGDRALALGIGNHRGAEPNAPQSDTQRGRKARPREGGATVSR